MSRNLAAALGCILASALAGCGVGSLSQTFPDNARVTDDRLLGTWHSEDATAVITSDGDQGYVILYTESDKTGRFLAHIGTAGSFRVLDVQPDKSLFDANDTYKDLTLALHSVLFIDSIGDRTASFRTLDPDSVQALVKRDPGAIAHAYADDALVLTASPEQMQAFLAGFGKRAGVLGDPAVFTKDASANAGH